MTGCDTSSRIFGVGKKPAFQKLVKGHPDLKLCAKAFTTENQSTDVIEDLGCKAMVILFGGKITDSLVSLRYKTFSHKVVTASSFVTPECLPPTHRRNQQLSSTVVEYITKSWFGWEKMTVWMPQTGDGNCRIIVLSHR